MFAGRVGSWERLQYRVQIEPNMQGTDGEGVSGVLTVPFAPDLSALAEYLKLTRALTVSGTTTSRVATVQLGSLTWTRTDTATVTAHELVVSSGSPAGTTRLSQTARLRGSSGGRACASTSTASRSRTRSPRRAVCATIPTSRLRGCR